MADRISVALIHVISKNVKTYRNGERCFYLRAFLATFIEARRKMQKLIRPIVFACLSFTLCKKMQKTEITVFIYVLLWIR